MTEPFRDVSGRAKGPLDGDAWDDRWKRADTPWDMGAPAPPFVHALAASRRLGLPEGARALVPGCGAGHDARLLAQQGFRVTGVDLSETALVHARELAKRDALDVEFVVADLFALPKWEPFDLSIEHTCFCAIDPSLRERYVDAIADALRPGGTLLGLFFLIQPEEGPPFGATAEEIEHRFGRRFDLVSREAPARHSHERRAGQEGLFRFVRRL